MENVEQLPPQDVDLESQILGCCLVEPEARETVCRQLAPPDFYRSAHQKIYSALLAMHLEGAAIDVGLLRVRLQEAGNLEEVGGVWYLAQLMSGVATTAHVEQYCDRVRDRALRRRAIQAATAVARRSFEEGVSTSEILDGLRDLVQDLERDRDVGGRRRMSDAYAELEELLEGRRKDLMHPTGFEALLELLPAGAFWPGMYVLGGPPGVGKTTFAMQLVEACLDDRPELQVLYVSGEMSAADLYLSCACRQAEMDQARVLSGAFSEADKIAFHHSLTTVGERLRRVAFSTDLRVSEIRRAVREQQPGLLVVDYLQLLKPDKDFQMAKDRIDAVARGMMDIREEFRRMPILLLASHNRGDARNPYQPGRGLGAYKETGDIEYSADRCLNLEYTKDEWQRWKSGEIESIVELNLVLVKNRLSRPGRVGVTFNGALQKFVLGNAQQYGHKLIDQAAAEGIQGEED